MVLMVRRDPAGVRLLTRNGIDWTGHFPLIAEAAGALQVRSFLMDGEAVACGDNGVPVFEKLRSRRADRYVFLSAFDLLDINGLDLRREPLEIRKRQLSTLLRDVRFGLQLNDQDEAGDVVFRHACKLGFEGIVSKPLGSRLGRSRDWVRRTRPRRRCVASWKRIGADKGAHGAHVVAGHGPGASRHNEGSTGAGAARAHLTYHHLGHRIGASVRPRVMGGTTAISRVRGLLDRQDITGVRGEAWN
jgi:bifunctional non-homologous end joining protein LigD